MTLGEFSALYPNSEVVFVGIVEYAEYGEPGHTMKTEPCDTPEQALNNANGLVLINKLSIYDPEIYVKANLIWNNNN